MGIFICDFMLVIIMDAPNSPDKSGRSGSWSIFVSPRVKTQNPKNPVKKNIRVA